MAEGSIASSLTSTSHTLTHAPGMSPSAAAPNGASPLALLETVSGPNRHAFLQPPAAIPSSSLNLVKDTLESFAGHVGDEQLRQVRDANRKRKRSERIRADEAEVLKVRRIHVDGFETGQVWQQAKRIIASTLKSSEEALRELEEQNGVVNGVNGDVESEEEDVSAGSDEDELEGEEESDEEGISGAYSEGEEADDMEMDGLSGEDDIDAEDEDAEMDEMDGMDGFEDEEEEEEESEEEPEELVEDVHGLNDGFFSIDNFNKQTQWFEEQDARGDPNTDLANDDEEIDWDADPYALPPAKSDKSKKGSSKAKSKLDLDSDEDDVEEEDDEDDEDDEGGPTFGNMDLYAPEGDSDIEADDLEPEEEDDDQGENANDVFYKDFFAPPPRKKGDRPAKDKKVRFEPSQPDDADIDRAIADVKRDLFEDLSDAEDSEDALSDVSAGDPRSRRSTHERRQAKIVDEIRKLEAAAVAKRDWTLTGEASAVERPVNSLLEEDLDFEHVGKPVPVITPEVTESIEELIKRRILAAEFDDVLRRRPDADITADARRGLVELDDGKSKKGLAEIYEEEHLKNANPDTYVSKADEKLRKEEAEVQNMWTDVCARLDALSSWHYKPRPAAPAITVVSDVATVAMEDAQPATAQGVAGGESAIAPQEVYRAGAKGTAEEGEVSRGGVPIAREEMSREEKTRRRRRAKERGRKEGGGEKKERAPPGKGSRKDTVADLKKGGVRVINKRGEILDVEGNKAREGKGVTGGGFKL